MAVRRVDQLLDQFAHLRVIKITSANRAIDYPSLFVDDQRGRQPFYLEGFRHVTVTVKQDRKTGVDLKLPHVGKHMVGRFPLVDG